MTDRGFRVRALGEIAIRCRDWPAMVAFYEDTLGLIPLAGDHNPAIRFFALGESYGGHTAVLALFPPGEAGHESGSRSSLHHIALTVDAAEQQAVVAWYEARGLACRIEEFQWIGWRGVFTEDPDGNTVELVARTGTGKAP